MLHLDLTVFVKPGLTDTSRNMFTVDREDDMKTPRLALYAGFPVRYWCCGRV